MQREKRHGEKQTGRKRTAIDFTEILLLLLFAVFLLRRRVGHAECLLLVTGAGGRSIVTKLMRTKMQRENQEKITAAAQRRGLHDKNKLWMNILIRR